MDGTIYADAKIIKSTGRCQPGKITLCPAALASVPDDTPAEQRLSSMLVEIEGQNYLIRWDSSTLPVYGERR